jgi:hypothetical protein
MRAHSLPWLFRHFEKALLAGALGWLAAVAVGFAAPAASQDASQLNGSMTVIARHMRTARPDAMARPEWKKQLDGQLEAEGVPQALPFGPWVMHQRPKVLYSSVPDLPPLELKYTPCSVGEVDASVRGQVSVQWSASGHGRHVLVDYALQRRVNNGAWTDLQPLDPNVTTVVDGDAAPDTANAYRVVSTASRDTEDVLVFEQGQTELPSEVPQRLVGPESAPETTLANTHFVLNSVQPGDPIRRRPGRAYVFVYRWNADRDDFDRRLFRVRVGKTIGTGAFKTDVVLSEVRVEQWPIAGGYTKAVGVVTLKTAKGSLTIDDQAKAGQ